MVKDSSIFSNLIANGEFRVDEKGHAILNGEFLLMVPPPVMLKLQERLEEQMGQDEMEDIITDLGSYQVSQALERYKERYGLDEVSKKKIIDYANNIVKVLGWGEISIEKIDGKDVRVIVKSPTLPSVYRNRREELSDQPICHYLRGMMSEGISETTGEKIELKETKCAAQGGDICVFETKD